MLGWLMKSVLLKLMSTEIMEYLDLVHELGNRLNNLQIFYSLASEKCQKIKINVLKARILEIMVSVNSMVPDN